MKQSKEVKLGQRSNFRSCSQISGFDLVLLNLAKWGGLSFFLALFCISGEIRIFLNFRVFLIFDFRMSKQGYRVITCYKLSNIIIRKSKF